MGVSDIFVFVADAIYDYALAADSISDDEDDNENDGELIIILDETWYSHVIG